MRTLQTISGEYLNYCKVHKNLDFKTIKAYRIDLAQFLSLIPTDTLPISKDILIQKMLGHSSITTTQIYTSVSMDKQKEILEVKHPRNGMRVDKG